MKAFELWLIRGYHLHECLYMIQKLAPDRPGQGFARHASRRLSLEHEALAHKNAINLQ